MNFYLNAWASIVRFSQDTITQLVSEGVSSSLQFIDWDAHAKIQELPPSDLLGPGGLALMDTHEEIVINFTIGVATHGDTQLFRQRTIVDRVHSLMRPQNQIVLYDLETSEPTGILVFTEGTSILPMSRSENHAVQFIQAEALLIQST